MNPKKHTLTESDTRLVVWTEAHSTAGCCGKSERTAFARKSKANTHFALKVQGGMTNQRAELEACAAILTAFDYKHEVGLGNMWVKTSVEQMLSWIEKKNQPTLRSEHKSVWRAMWETLVQIPQDGVTLRHAPAHLGCQMKRGSKGK